MSATLPRSLRLGQLSALPPPSCSLIFSLALYCLRAGRGRDMRPPWSSPPKLHGCPVSLLQLFLRPNQPRLILPPFAPHLPIELFRRLCPCSSSPPAPPPWPSSELAAAAVPCLRASPLLASSTNTSSWFPRTRTTHPRPRRRRELRRHRAVAYCGRRHTWPGHHELPRAKTSCPMGAREVPGAPPTSLPRPETANSRASSAPNPVEDLARQFDDSQGPICNVIDSSE